MKGMVSKIKKYFSIILQMQKSNIMNDMAYPLPFLGKVASVFLVMILGVIFINVTFNYITTLSGWNYYQVLAAVGSYMTIDGLFWIFCSQLSSFNVLIKDGDLDWILLKPIDPQFLISFWRGDLEDIARCVTGFTLIFIALKNTIGFSLPQILLFLITLACGMIIIYSLSFALRSISFWVIDGSGVWLLMQRITENSQFPVDIYYNKIVRGLFTFIIPLAFVATVPAKLLTNQLIDWKWLVLSLLMAVVFFIGARMFWKFSLKHYSSASS